jgi:mannose-1-phosphate guanylyltransferase
MDPITSAAWASVLAGGKGRRLAQLTEGIPKQFWGYAPGGTLLESTLLRIVPLVPAA